MKKFSHFAIRDITVAAVTAALYAALTVVFAPISYGVVQFRVSEALTLLPILFPQAVPGLTVGCLVSNLIGGNGIWDVVFGTLATLLAGVLTRKLRSRVWLAALPPVLVNAGIVGSMLSYLFALPLFATVASVGLGELAVVAVLGIPMILALQKVPALHRLSDRLTRQDR